MVTIGEVIELLTRFYEIFMEYFGDIIDAMFSSDDEESEEADTEVTE